MSAHRIKEKSAHHGRLIRIKKTRDIVRKKIGPSNSSLCTQKEDRINLI